MNTANDSEKFEIFFFLILWYKHSYVSDINVTVVENPSFTAFPFSSPSLQSFTYFPPVLATSPRRGMMLALSDNV